MDIISRLEKEQDVFSRLQVLASFYQENNITEMAIDHT